MNLNKNNLRTFTSKEVWTSWYRPSTVIIDIIEDLVGRQDVIINATKFYVVDGYLDRDNGPAYISSTVEMWFKMGTIHRLNGPAICWTSCANKNHKEKTWVVNGKQICPFDKLPLFEDGINVSDVPLNEVVVMDAMRFDREYARYLHKKLRGKV